MVIDVYKVKIPHQLDNWVLEKAVDNLTANHKEKILSLRKKDDQIRSLFGSLLIKKLQNELRIVSDIEINYYGKPYFKDNNATFFNISHSKDYVICAIASQPVGIDIEYIKPIDFSICEFIFSEKEKSTFSSLSKKDKLNYLLLIWTLKESYLKMMGIGLNLELHRLSVTIRNENISLFLNGFKEAAYFHSTKIENSYYLSICVNKSFQKVNIHEICNNDLITSILPNISNLP